MVKILTTKTLILIALAISIYVALKESDECSDYRSITSDNDKYSLIISWVDNYDTVKPRSLKNLALSSSSMKPGDLEILVDFPWEKIGFQKQSKVMLVAPPRNGNLDVNDAISVFFGEQSGHGILVKFANSPSFDLIEIQGAEVVTERVAILCIPRD